MLWGFFNEEILKNKSEDKFNYGDRIDYGDMWVIELIFLEMTYGWILDTDMVQCDFWYC